jgi:hypothetical protein
MEYFASREELGARCRPGRCLGGGERGIRSDPAAEQENCTAPNKRCPHGLGRLGARDKTSGTPVTTFRRSTPLYRLAVSYNRGLDRDKDGIACKTA